MRLHALPFSLVVFLARSRSCLPPSGNCAPLLEKLPSSYLVLSPLLLTYFLSLGPFSQPQHEHHTQSDSLDHLLSLVNNFLDFESMDQLVLEWIPFLLTNEALKVINVLALLANKKKIKLQHAVNVHYDVHIGDPLRYSQHSRKKSILSKLAVLSVAVLTVPWQVQQPQLVST